MARVLLLIPTTSYRARPFLKAARRLGAEVVVGTEHDPALRRLRPPSQIRVDFSDEERAVEQIVAADAERGQGFDAVVGVDDGSTLVAALAGRALELPGNNPEAVRATRDKFQLRAALAGAGANGHWFERIAFNDDLEAIAVRMTYPCVLKPLHLNAGRGVIRADNPEEFLRAAARIAQIVAGADSAVPSHGSAAHFLVEEYLPGPEVAVEAMLVHGNLKPLAIFDKPDPLDGPFFEETIYVTPSRHSPETQRAILDAVSAACAAIGLREGPVHAELRLREPAHEGEETRKSEQSRVVTPATQDDREEGVPSAPGGSAILRSQPMPIVIDLAGRSIGGL